ncbi:MAG: FCD domain-containing protein [Rhodospirillum sp.]|nr:FCD domain-containing protein [Rhodospirillum sp.]MCF8489718.1 FCD domain-containing protein [Rhodospirillum sp.]
MSKSEQVAQLLLAQIIDTGIKPGTSFGTEASLLERYRVSRPTLRESLRILESHGVLSLRPGPRGGIIINKPSVDFLAHTLSVYLRLNDVPFIAVVHAREAIEPALAREAARNGTDEHFREMGDSIARMAAIRNDQKTFIEENRVFHGLIAKAAANPVLAAFWSTISILASGEGHGVRYSARNQAHVVDAHRRILEACQARDEEAAAAVMGEHVRELEALLRARYQELLDEPTRIASRPSRKIG